MAAGAVDRGIGILRGVAAGRIDQHGFSVNHQSQSRVPPTPATRPAHSAASGNFSPQFSRAVVLPAPGGPMMAYHGCS